MQLGWMVRQELSERETDGRRNRRKYSKPRKTESQALREYDQKVKQHGV